MNPRPHRHRGFTLVEVLVAIVVMAIMSLMAWQGVDGVVRARDANQARLEQTLRLETVVTQWEQDLASVQDTKGTVPALTCDGQTVRLTRRVEGGMQVIAWALRPDSTNAMWQRWAGPVATTRNALQESWLQTQQFQGGEPGQLRALAGLESWQVYFYRGNAWTNCQSSGDAASSPAGTGSIGSTSTQALPDGVRLVLAFAPGSGLAGSLMRDTQLAP